MPLRKKNLTADNADQKTALEVEMRIDLCAFGGEGAKDLSRSTRRQFEFKKEHVHGVKSALGSPFRATSRLDCIRSNNDRRMASSPMFIIVETGSASSTEWLLKESKKQQEKQSAGIQRALSAELLSQVFLKQNSESVMCAFIL